MGAAVRDQSISLMTSLLARFGFPSFVRPLTLLVSISP